MLYMLVLVVLAYLHPMLICLPCLVAIIKDTLFSSSICVTNNVEKTEDTMGQDKILDGASSSSSSSSSHGSFTCLMARSSKVSPPLEPFISSDDEVDDMEGLNVASLNMMGELFFHALHKKKFACSNFMKILAFAIESTKIYLSIIY